MSKFDDFRYHIIDELDIVRDKLDKSANLMNSVFTEITELYHEIAEFKDESNSEDRGYQNSDDENVPGGPGRPLDTLETRGDRLVMFESNDAVGFEIPIDVARKIKQESQSLKNIMAPVLKSIDLDMSDSIQELLFINAAMLIADKLGLSISDARIVIFYLLGESGILE